VKYTSPTLLIIAALAAAPGVHALTVKDDDVKLGLGVRIQARAEFNDSENAAGDPYDAGSGSAHGGDPVDFMIRRMRLTFKGSWKSDYFFNVTMASDKRTVASGSTIDLYESYIGRKWSDEASGISHSIQTGLANAFYNGVANTFSSGAFLLPNSRATELLLASRGIGIAYMMTAPFGRFGIDIQNNTSDAAGDQDGLFYSARVELTPPGELAIKSATESFVGAEGKGVWLALDYAQNVSNGSADSSFAVGTTTGYGIELLGHVDGLTALAEYRADTHENSTNDTETKKKVMLVQAGYALPFGDAVIEPAIRWAAIDLDTEDDEEGDPYGSKYDYGTSGTQIDLGVNYYIHKHNNKLQLAYTMWEGEETEDGDSASADIVRAQWQLNF